MSEEIYLEIFKMPTDRRHYCCVRACHSQLEEARKISNDCVLYITETTPYFDEIISAKEVQHEPPYAFEILFSLKLRWGTLAEAKREIHKCIHLFKEYYSCEIWHTGKYEQRILQFRKQRGEKYYCHKNGYSFYIDQSQYSDKPWFVRIKIQNQTIQVNTENIIQFETVSEAVDFCSDFLLGKVSFDSLQRYIKLEKEQAMRKKAQIILKQLPQYNLSGASLFSLFEEMSKLNSTGHSVIKNSK